MPGFDPGELSHYGQIAVRVWNLMDGKINWAALPVVAEMLGVMDIEMLLTCLIAIRDFQKD